jgi:Zn-dependent alcohol dehydrogenase
MQITAAVAREHTMPFTIEQLELDDPRHNEVRVRMVVLREHDGRRLRWSP